MCQILSAAGISYPAHTHEQFNITIIELGSVSVGNPVLTLVANSVLTLVANPVLTLVANPMLTLVAGGVTLCNMQVRTVWFCWHGGPLRFERGAGYHQSSLVCWQD